MSDSDVSRVDTTASGFDQSFRSDDEEDASDRRQVSFADLHSLGSQAELSVSQRARPQDFQRSGNSMTRSLAIMAITNQFTPERGAAKALFKLKGLVSKRRADEAQLQDINDENTQASSVAQKLDEVQEDANRSIVLRRNASSLRGSFRGSLSGRTGEPSEDPFGSDDDTDVEQLRVELAEREHQIISVTEIGKKLEVGYKERGFEIRDLLAEVANLRKENEELGDQGYILQEELKQKRKLNNELKTEVLMLSQNNEDYARLQDTLEKKEAQIDQLKGKVKSERNDAWAGNMLSRALNHNKAVEAQLAEKQKILEEQKENALQEIEIKAEQVAKEKITKANRMKELAIMALKQSQADAQEKRDKEMQKKFEEHDAVVEGFTLKVSNQEASIELLQQKLDESQAEVLSRTDEITEVQRQLRSEAGKQLDAKVAELQHTIDAKDTENTALRSELHDVSQLSVEYENAVLELKNENDKYALSIETMKKEVESNAEISNKRVQAAGERERALNESCTDMHEKCTAVEKQLRDAQSAHIQEVSELKNASMQLQQKLETLTRDCEQTADEVVQCKSKHAADKVETEDLKKAFEVEIQGVTERFQLAKNEISTLKQQATALKGELDASERRGKEAAVTVEDLNKNIHTAAQQAELQRSELLEKLDTSEHSWKREAASLQQEVGQLQQQLSQERQRAQEIEQSHTQSSAKWKSLLEDERRKSEESLRSGEADATRKIQKLDEQCFQVNNDFSTLKRSMEELHTQHQDDQKAFEKKLKQLDREHSESEASLQSQFKQNLEDLVVSHEKTLVHERDMHEKEVRQLKHALSEAKPNGASLEQVKSALSSLQQDHDRTIEELNEGFARQLDERKQHEQRDLGNMQELKRQNDALTRENKKAHNDMDTLQHQQQEALLGTQKQINDLTSRNRELEHKMQTAQAEASQNAKQLQTESTSHEERCRSIERQRDEKMRMGDEALHHKTLELAALQERVDQGREDLRQRDVRVAEVLSEMETLKATTNERVAAAMRDTDTQQTEVRRLDELLTRERHRSTEQEEQAHSFRDALQEEKNRTLQARTDEANAIAKLKDALQKSNDQIQSLNEVRSQQLKAETQAGELRTTLKAAEARLQREQLQHADAVNVLKAELLQAREGNELSAREGRSNAELMQKSLEDARADMQRREHDHSTALAQLSNQVRQAEARASTAEAAARVRTVDIGELEAQLHEATHQLKVKAEEAQTLRLEIEANDGAHTILQQELATARSEWKRAIEGSEDRKHSTERLHADHEEALEADLRAKQRELGVAQREAADAKRAAEALTSKVGALERRNADLAASGREAVLAETATAGHWETVAEGLKKDVASLEEEGRRQAGRISAAKEDTQREKERARTLETKAAEATATAERLQGEITMLIDAQCRVTDSAAMARSGVEEAIQRNLREHEAVCDELDSQKQKLKTASDRAEAAEEEARKLRSDLQSATRKLASHTDSNHASESQLEKAYGELNTAKARAEELRRDEVLQTRRAASLEREAETANASIAEYKRRDTAMRRENESAFRDLKESGEKVLRLEAEVADLRTRIAESEDGSARHTVAVSAAEKRGAEYEARLRTAAKELAEERRSAAAHETQVSTLASELDVCKERLASVEREHEEAARQLHAKEVENASLTEQMFASVASAGSGSTRAAAAERQLHQQREDSSAARTEAARLRRELDRVRLQHSNELSSKEALSSQLEGRAKSLQLDLERADERCGEMAAVKNDLLKKQMQTSELEAKLSSAQGEISTLKRTLARVKEEASHEVQGMARIVATTEDTAKQQLHDMRNASTRHASLAQANGSAVVEAQDRHDQLARECAKLRERCNTLEMTKTTNAAELTQLRERVKTAESDAQDAELRATFLKNASRASESRALSETEAKLALEQRLSQARSPQRTSSPTFARPDRDAEDALRRELRSSARHNMQLQGEVAHLRRSASPQPLEAERSHNERDVVKKMRQLTTHVDVCSSPVQDLTSRYYSVGHDTHMSSRMADVATKVNVVADTLSSLPHGSPRTLRFSMPHQLLDEEFGRRHSDGSAHTPSSRSSTLSPKGLNTPPAEAVTPSATPQQMHLPKDDIAHMAASLLKTMKGFGTDEEGLYDELHKVQTQQDWEALQSEFARAHPTFNKGNLKEAIKDELTARELTKAKEIVSGKGISW